MLVIVFIHRDGKWRVTFKKKREKGEKAFAVKLLVLFFRIFFLHVRKKRIHRR